MHLLVETKYSGVQNFKKFDSRVFQSGDIVHFLRLTHRKVEPFNRILGYHRKGAWNRVWQKSPNLVVEMTRADIHQLDFTKGSQ